MKKFASLILPEGLNKSAFTLAEVLITLAIVGVVAAMTLPALIQKQHDKETVSRLKAAYSILSQAALLAQNEYGTFETWNILDNNQNSTREIFSYFEPHLKIIRKCDNKPGCWAKSTKSLTGQTVQWTGDQYNGVDYINFTLANGMNIAYDHCAAKYAFFGLPNDIMLPFIHFIVDINGNKGPNTLGKDIFSFSLDKNGLRPFGIGNDSQNCSRSINGNTSGYGCAYKVLKEEAINY